MIDRIIQDRITGISTDKKKVLISCVVELLTSMADEMEQITKHIEELEREVKELKDEIQDK